MGNKLKQLLLLNRSDLLYAAGTPALPFALIHLITMGVMYFIHPDESILISGVLLPICVGIAAFAVTAGNVQVNFAHAVRCSVTRKRALALTVGLTGLESLFALAVGAVLMAYERCLAMDVWRFLSGDPGLLVDDFGFVWWALPLGWLAGYLLGFLYGALILRFGSKATWLPALFWFGCVFGMQLLPWKTHEVTNVLFPALALGAALSAAWAVRSMLRLSISK